MTQIFPITEATLEWLEKVLAERFGLEFQLKRFNREFWLQIRGLSGAIVFDAIVPGFSEATSNQPITKWHAEAEGWNSVLKSPLPAPGVSCLPTPLIERRGPNTHVHYDILGLTYWMLARVEEIGRNDVDSRDRFPATSSHAYKFRYLDRPVVDEWLHVLGQVIGRQWLGIRLRQHTFKLNLSHDVDRPSRYGFADPKNFLRRLCGDLYGGKLRDALTAPIVWTTTKATLHVRDPYNTFSWIMDQSEARNLQSVFYFISGRTNRLLDGEYEISHTAIRKLLRTIHARGHSIGLHPSYDTYRDAQKLVNEVNALQKVCHEENIPVSLLGMRMHYLRWKHPETLQIANAAGLAYDTTLMYADHVGFRCGTAFEYPAFDPITSDSLAIRIRPLVVMEGTLFAKQYMNLPPPLALETLLSLKAKCRSVGGQFSLLWHNSELERHRDIYLSGIDT